MSDFLWHKVSEKEKEEIKKEAKAIMDSFSKKLEKIKEKTSEPIIEREKCEREEGKTKKTEIDRKIMFDNAPNKSDDFIVAEKGGWR
jgi:Asp-tRNA(Asn)/Glu-tRNA(Gln) amidotransferase C subunit